MAEKINRAPDGNQGAVAVDKRERKQPHTILPKEESKLVVVWESRGGPTDVQFQIAASAPPIDQCILCAVRGGALGIVEGGVRGSAIPAVMAMVEDGIRRGFGPCRIVARIKISFPERPGWLP
jgi:hypothetical protein